MGEEAHRPPPFAVAPDDPLMQKAFERARASFEELEALFFQRPRDTYVRVAHAEPGAAEPWVWGQLVAIEGESLRLRRTNPPMAGDAPPQEPFSVPRAALEDWQVELPDGNIRGGFTMEVQFLRAAQEWGGLPPWMAKQHVRYVDHGWNEAEDAPAPRPPEEPQPGA
ncbi:MAG: DUF2314 domain-containing protein [Planctomycetota bacterium]|nr:DUF2314 domain-containing protein [Planctomycetota bacterium]